MVREAAGALAACSAVVVGILAARPVEPQSAVGLVVAAAALALGAVLGPRRLAPGFALLALASLAAAADLRARDGLDVPFADLLERGRVRLRGEVVSDPEPAPFEVRVVVRALALDGDGRRWVGGRRHVLAAAPRGPAASALAVLEVGDRVVVTGRLDDLAEHERWRRSRHVAVALDDADVVDLRPPRDPLLRAANGVRRAVLRGSAGLPPRDRALVAGFLVGDTRGLPDHVRDDFTDSGLGHLLAVSGSNVAFVLALVGPLLRRLRLGLRLAAGLGVLLVFAAATRFEPSVLRASVMAAVAMVGAFAGRRPSGLRALGVTAAALLLVDPLLLDAAAFQLSCAASLGILLWAVPLARRLPGPRWAAEPLATTVAAQAGVAPVLVPTFGSMPLVALPANVVAAPLAGPLTVWGALSGIVGGALSGVAPDLAGLLQVPTLVMVRAVSTVASLAGRVPIRVGPVAALAIAAVAVLAALVSRPRTTRART